MALIPFTITAQASSGWFVEQQQLRLSTDDTESTENSYPQMTRMEQDGPDSIHDHRAGQLWMVC
jgi:hypothetical protein